MNIKQNTTYAYQMRDGKVIMWVDLASIAPGLIDVKQYQIAGGKELQELINAKS